MYQHWHRILINVIPYRLHIEVFDFGILVNYGYLHISSAYYQNPMIYYTELHN